MSTAPVVPAVKAENGFERFIDKLVPFLKKAAPVVLEGAEAAAPLLALTPIGPEYNIALAGINTAIQADNAMQAASSVPLTGTQKMAIAVTAVQPALTSILATKGVTEPAAVQTAVGQFMQNVYNFQTGPAVATPVANA